MADLTNTSEVYRELFVLRNKHLALKDELIKNLQELVESRENYLRIYEKWEKLSVAIVRCAGCKFWKLEYDDGFNICTNKETNKSINVVMEIVNTGVREGLETHKTFGCINGEKL